MHTDRKCTGLTFKNVYGVTSIMTTVEFSRVSHVGYLGQIMYAIFILGIRAIVSRSQNKMAVMHMKNIVTDT